MLTEETSHRPWPMPSTPWVMSTRWHDLLSLHWPIAADAIRSLIPREIELPFSTDKTSTPLAVAKFSWRASGRRIGIFWPPTPKKLRLTRPSRMRHTAANLAVLMAVAKQIPCTGKMIAVLTPITSPREFTKGPPEFPGLSAASVWITLSINLPVFDRSDRPMALTTPAIARIWEASCISGKMNAVRCPLLSVK